MQQEKYKYRLERDPLGQVRVPSEALYGVQTQRALNNFPISRLRIHHALITALAEIKQAAAEANIQTGRHSATLGEAVILAAKEVIAGQWREQFCLDVFQAGAGTSYNMNVNEVIANRALELLGFERGAYAQLHPNDHVNQSQSTNDVMPTAMRIAALRLLHELAPVLAGLSESFDTKALEFSGVTKSGRTHLHDATPMTLGQEFAGYAENLARALRRLQVVEDSLLEVPLGGTAIGTGINTHADYARLAVTCLSRITGLALREAPNRIQSQHSLGDFLALSAALRGYAVELNKIANDLRLLSSGPHTGLDEIELPAVQPGSSIMPGKVNPVMAEMVNMVCFHVIGHDLAITLCAEAGQLELNVMMPYVAYALLEALEIMKNAAQAFDEKCVRGIRAHPERCREYAERSVGRATSLNQTLGFMGAAEIAQRAIETGKSIDELLRER
ncbi:MAG: aspartate ammonia-lyase [Acidobacteria bacterium]|nr:aspartate ammonia-lyase [Acidobacteriota bacterium]MBI3422366.1 aspartate ammonia-lyase [Acidobacteriota bacterium]